MDYIHVNPISSAREKMVQKVYPHTRSKNLCIGSDGTLRPIFYVLNNDIKLFHKTVDRVLQNDKRVTKVHPMKSAVSMHSAKGLIEALVFLTEWSSPEIAIREQPLDVLQQMICMDKVYTSNYYFRCAHYTTVLLCNVDHSYLPELIDVICSEYEESVKWVDNLTCINRDISNEHYESWQTATFIPLNEQLHSWYDHVYIYDNIDCKYNPFPCLTSYLKEHSLDFHNAVISVKNKEIKVNKGILSSRSEYFNTLFHTNVGKDRKTFTIKHGSYKTVYSVIEYIYGKQEPIYDVQNMLDIWSVADYLGVTDLIRSLLRFIVHHLYILNIDQLYQLYLHTKSDERMYDVPVHSIIIRQISHCCLDDDFYQQIKKLPIFKEIFDDLLISDGHHEFKVNVKTVFNSNDEILDKEMQEVDDSSDESS
jgi:hypothetical protein